MIANCQPQTANRKGFTLIEIVVTLSIVVIGFFAIMQIFPFTLKISNSTQNLTTAVFLTQAGMEESLGLSYDVLGVGVIKPKARLSNDSSSYLYSFQRQTTVEYVDEDLQTAGSDTDLKKIEVIVFWTDQLNIQEKSYTLTTLVSRK